MKAVEKRDFIHSHLHIANESILDEFYEKLRHEELLRKKLEARAHKSELDIQAGRVFSRADIEAPNAKLDS